MSRCLSDAALISLLAGDGTADERAHMTACAACGDTRAFAWWLAAPTSSSPRGSRVGTKGRASDCCELDRILGLILRSVPGRMPVDANSQGREFVGGGQSVGEVVTGWVG